MQNLKLVRNITSIPQSIVYKGRQVVLKAGVEERMDEALADAFVATCTPNVEFVDEDDVNLFDPDSANEYVWLANVTGDPRVPKTMSVRTLKTLIDGGVMRKQYVNEEIPNQAAIPHPVCRAYAPGDVSYTGKDGSPLTKTLPPVDILIPIGRRRKVKKDMAEWFLKREGNRRCVIRSRSDTSFEPTFAWALDDMRAYLKLISSDTATLGLDEAGVAKEAKKRRLSVEDTAQLLKDTKAECMATLWFYVCDPQYRLPTKEKFREFVTGKSSEDLAIDEAAKLLGQAEVAGRLTEANAG